MRSLRRVACALAVFALGGAAHAQDQFPNKLIRVIAAASGGNADVLARFLQTGLAAGLGQQVVIDNRGPIAPAVAAKSPPDGHNLLMTGSSVWLLPLPAARS